MGIVHELKLPKKDQIWLIASDFHGKILHRPTYNILIKHALLLPQEHRNIVINGDFLDTSYLMPKNSSFQKFIKSPSGVDDYFLPEWEAELGWGNNLLDELQSVFKNIIFINGNHDNPRADIFRENYCPIGYKEHFNIGKGLNLEKRNIGEVLYGDFLDFGSELSITHGNAHGSSAHKKHFDMSGGRSVIFGHIHHDECRTFATRGHSRSVWSLPCMAELNMHYLKNIPTNWQNGYGALMMRPCGNFNFNNLVVKNDKLILPNGQVIKA